VVELVPRKKKNLKQNYFVGVSEVFEHSGVRVYVIASMRKCDVSANQ